MVTSPRKFNPISIWLSLSQPNSTCLNTVAIKQDTEIATEPSL